MTAKALLAYDGCCVVGRRQPKTQLIVAVGEPHVGCWQMDMERRQRWWMLRSAGLFKHTSMEENHKLTDWRCQPPKTNGAIRSVRPSHFTANVAGNEPNEVLLPHSNFKNMNQHYRTKQLCVWCWSWTLGIYFNLWVKMYKERPGLDLKTVGEPIHWARGGKRIYSMWICVWESFKVTTKDKTYRTIQTASSHTPTCPSTPICGGGVLLNSLSQSLVCNCMWTK